MACHRCDNPPCVNPEHIFLGTQVDNMRDMKEKGRRMGIVAVRGEQQGHSVLTASDVKQIRAERAAGVGLLELSLKYGTTKGNIWAVVHRKSWKHIA